MKNDPPIKLTIKGPKYLLPKRFKPKIAKRTYTKRKKPD